MSIFIGPALLLLLVAIELLILKALNKPIPWSEITMNLNSGEVFLIADAAWVKENYIEMKLPSPIVKLFFSSWSDFKKSLERVHRYHNQHPSTSVIPCHCFSTLMELNPDSVEL